MSISSLLKKYEHYIDFHEPAPPEDMSEVGETIGVPLPDELRKLLAFSNGANAVYKLPEIGETVNGLYYACEELLEFNEFMHSFDDKEFRDQGHEPLKSFLFFASTPNGDYLAYYLSDGRVAGPDIFRVSHEDYGDRSVVARSFEDYLAQLLDRVSKIAVN